jgi:hypothetical protein
LKIFCLYVLILIAICTLPSFSSGIYPQYEPADDSAKIIEKAYLHTDRESYYPGDDIWFKAYLVDASDLILTNHSNNLHVELISPNSEIIQSRTIKLDDGLGYGDFKLEGKLQSGNYLIRVYSNYMRNFGDHLFFNKHITIINPVDALKTFTDGPDNIGNGLDISFFPEGGSLVDSVPSLVAFKAVNDTGEVNDVTGEVYSSTGDLVTTFRSSHEGIGAFAFNPVTGVKYYAIVKYTGGNSAKIDIPKSFITGIVLGVTRKSDKKIVVSLKTNITTLSILSDQDLQLTVSARNEVYKTFNIRIKSLSSFIVLPVDDLPNGIFKITLTGQQHEPLCERLIYVQNNEDLKLNLEINKKIYNQRDSVTIKIAFTKNSDDAYLSFSATKNITINNPRHFTSTISSWFLLESDVKGPVGDPSYYFDPSNPNRLKDLDLLLLTQGWRDFKWKYEKIEYPTENGFTISGRIRKLFADEPLNDSKANIGVFSNGNPVVSSILTDSSGRFSVTGFDFSGTAKLIVSASGNNERVKGMVLLDTLGYSPEIVNYSANKRGEHENKKQLQPSGQGSETEAPYKENLTAFLQYAEFKNSISRKYKLSDTINPGEVTITARHQDKPESARMRSRHYLFGPPDKEILITPEYEKYSNVRQLFMTRLHFSPRLNRIIFLLDGVRVSGEIFMSVPVNFIEKIDILDTQASIAVFGANTELPAFQDKPANGVFSITTRSKIDFSSDIHKYHTVNTVIHGYSEPRLFYSPKHHETLQSDFKPDLRTTLYWEPNIILETGKDLFVNYFNADNPSKVTVIVEGITSSGIPVAAKTEYEVK